MSWMLCGIKMNVFLFVSIYAKQIINLENEVFQEKNCIFYFLLGKYDFIKKSNIVISSLFLSVFLYPQCYQFHF